MDMVMIQKLLSMGLSISVIKEMQAELPKILESMRGNTTLSQVIGLALKLQASGISPEAIGPTVQTIIGLETLNLLREQLAITPAKDTKTT
jgi:hypothetical protein